MNGETLEYYVDESFDDESFDDESFDDETAEFLPGPLGGLVSGITNTLLPGLGGLLGGQKPPPPPLPTVQLPPASPGVTSAQLNTPAGSATLALPSALVRQDEFRAAITPLKQGIDRNTSRLNTVAADLTKLRNDFIRIETDTRNQVAKLRTDTRKYFAKSRKEQAAALAKMKKEQSSQQMTNLMMTIMMQQTIQDELNSHTHAIADHTHVVSDPTAGKATASALPALTANASSTDDSDSSFLMMLPLMMMQDGGSGSDNMMMPLMMMMAFK